MTSCHAWLRYLGVVAMALNLTACDRESSPPSVPLAAGTEQTTQPAVTAPSAPSPVLDEEVLRTSASAYLEALRINDLATAYRMEYGSQDGSLSPLAFREILPRGVLLSYAITSSSLENSEGMVEADVSVQLPQMRTPYQTKRQMQWLVEDGKLYHKSKPLQQGLGQVLTKPSSVPLKPAKQEPPKPLPWETKTGPN